MLASHLQYVMTFWREGERHTSLLLPLDIENPSYETGLNCMWSRGLPFWLEKLGSISSILRIHVDNKFLTHYLHCVMLSQLTKWISDIKMQEVDHRWRRKSV